MYKRYTKLQNQFLNTRLSSRKSSDVLYSDIALVERAGVSVDRDTKEDNNTGKKVGKTHESVVINLRASCVGKYRVNSSGDSCRDETGDDGEGTDCERLQKLLIIQIEVHRISIMHKKIFRSQERYVSSYSLCSLLLRFLFYSSKIDFFIHILILNIYYTIRL